MRLRITRAQRARRTVIRNLLHGVERQIGGLRRLDALRLREALIEHGAVFRDHRAYRRERRTVAAAGDRLERLRHFDRRQVKRAEQHRRHRVELIFRHAQFGPGIHYRVQPQRHAEIDRRHVHGVGQRVYQHHLAAKATIVVHRFPDGAVRLLQRDRFISDPAVETIGVRLAERGQIGRRFRQRADRATRLQRTVIAGELRIGAADHGAHFAAEAVDHHHRGFQIFQAALFFQRRDAVEHRFFRRVLRDRIERGEDLHAGEIFYLVAQLRLQLVTHHLHKGGLRRDDAAFRLYAERARREHVVELLVDHLLLLQQAQHQIASLQR